jgi:hypothetical protein
MIQIEVGGRLRPPRLRGYGAAILERLLAILRGLELTPHYGRVIQHRVIQAAVLAMTLDRQQDAGFGMARWPSSSRIGMRPLFTLLTMSVEAKIKVITCWSLCDSTNRKIPPSRLESGNGRIRRLWVGSWLVQLSGSYDSA